MEHLSHLGFNIYSTLIVDILHEFDIGILKTILQHLLRILYKVDPTCINVLNKRYFLSRYIILELRYFVVGLLLFRLSA